MGRRKTTEEFRQEVQSLGEGHYKLCSEYKDSHSKVELFHTVCGRYYNVSPTSFLGGTRCPYCAGCMKNTTDNFKKEVKVLTGEDYTVLGDYKNANTKIKMRHNKCGYIYYVTPYSFRRKGSRCPKCFGHSPYTNKTFQDKLNSIYGSQYILLGGYVNNHTKVRIKHTICGAVYMVRPNDILRGKRCPACYGTPKKTTEQFKQEVYDLVGDEYTALGEYKGTDTKITIKHNKCGYVWKITPNKFLHGRRCPRCNESHGERAIRKYLESNHIQYESQKRFDDCRYKKPLPFDFYLPTLRIAIEFDGTQHFIPFKHFGGKKKLKLYKKRDSIKNNYCLENNIKLIRINYQINLKNIDEFLNKLIKGGY